MHNVIARRANSEKPPSPLVLVLGLRSPTPGDLRKDKTVNEEGDWVHLLTLKERIDHFGTVKAESIHLAGLFIAMIQVHCDHCSINLLAVLSGSVLRPHFRRPNNTLVQAVFNVVDRDAHSLLPFGD